MGITLTLPEVRKYYRHFFNYEMPESMAYTKAVKYIVKEAGYDMLRQLQKEERIKLEEGGV